MARPKIKRKKDGTPDMRVAANRRKAAEAFAEEWTEVRAEAKARLARLFTEVSFSFPEPAVPQYERVDRLWKVMVR